MIWGVRSRFDHFLVVGQLIHRLWWLPKSDVYKLFLPVMGSMGCPAAEILWTRRTWSLMFLLFLNSLSQMSHATGCSSNCSSCKSSYHLHFVTWYRLVWFQVHWPWHSSKFQVSSSKLKQVSSMDFSPTHTKFALVHMHVVGLGLFWLRQRLLIIKQNSYPYF